jgi:hypothetical protein
MVSRGGFLMAFHPFFPSVKAVAFGSPAVGDVEKIISHQIGLVYFRDYFSLAPFNDPMSLLGVITHG